MKQYRHIFFDLDHTLWDFERNSRETLQELFETYSLAQKGIPDFESFYQTYTWLNDVLWDQYRKGKITKEKLREKRFHDALNEFGIDDKKTAMEFGDDYIRHSPVKKNLMPFTVEILEYLDQYYELHIITNGFEEVQHVKLSNCGIDRFFQQVVTSERAGHKKPAPGIFHYSLKNAGAKRKESVMIGDNIVSDLRGARKVGIDQVFYNPQRLSHNEKITYEIDCLSALKDIL